MLSVKAPVIRIIFLIPIASVFFLQWLNSLHDRFLYLAKQNVYDKNKHLQYFINNAFSEYVVSENVSD